MILESAPVENIVRALYIRALKRLPEPVKAARLAELQDLLAAQTRAFNQATIGRTLPVLLDRRGRHAGQLLGRSPYMQPVHADLPAERLGQVVALTIVEGTANSLSGRPEGARAGA